ncbi:MAG: prepilin-type N-terminal cleavage/methylation domain-containing protein [Candidatus Pacebacteria bacterium]|nr:prepilin-type N-terminal cleavage/methylation domain-containing protein [Candidatus Paceibacterota bacterium]
MSMRSASRGFTLIELLVVIAIIGMLSSVVLASLNSARMKARDTKRQSDIHQIELAMKLYESANNFAPIVGPGGYIETFYPTTPNSGLAPLLVPTYMSAVPNDPKWMNVGGNAYFYYVANWDAAAITTNSWSFMGTACANKEVLVVRVMENTTGKFRQDCAMLRTDVISIIIQ